MLWRMDQSHTERILAAYGGEREVPVKGGEPPLRGMKGCFSIQVYPISPQYGLMYANMNGE
jgi:hypothetical protein